MGARSVGMAAGVTDGNRESRGAQGSSQGTQTAMVSAPAAGRARGHFPDGFRDHRAERLCDRTGGNPAQRCPASADCAGRHGRAGAAGQRQYGLSSRRGGGAVDAAPHYRKGLSRICPAAGYGHLAAWRRGAGAFGHGQASRSGDVGEHGPGCRDQRLYRASGASRAHGAAGAVYRARYGRQPADAGLRSPERSRPARSGGARDPVRPAERGGPDGADE